MQGASPRVQDVFADALRHHQVGRLNETERLCRQVLAVDPHHADSQHLLGVVANQTGRYDLAINMISQAIAINAKVASYHSNLGNALKDQGNLEKLEEAVACYRQALVLKPDFAEAHYNLGNALRDQGKLNEAVTCYRHALILKPDIAEAHVSLGNVLRDQGKLDETEACYRQALVLKPDYTYALNNFALLLMVQSKFIMALNIIKQSLQIKEAAKTKKIFVDCIKRLHCTNDDDAIRIAMVRALTEPWSRPSELVRVSTDLIKLNPEIGKCVARAADAWPRRLTAQDLFGSNGLTALATNELLCALLSSTPISDIEMERFLTMARCLMLEVATGEAMSDEEVGTVLSFYSALARQCFINEYVFCHTDYEIQKANHLRDLLVAALEAKTQVPVLWVLTVAAYFPLCSLPLAARLLDTQWPEAITAILLQQVQEPQEELQLRTTIPRLTNIEDEVSRLVQNQYEENPYPRWVKAEPAGNPITILGYLCQKFPLASFKRHSKSGITEFLIAGCGTGQHSIETAQAFKGARVLAVDLSLSSLSYAKRKTRELGLTSIEYAQADLLELGSLGRSFDVIESVGVLHHLADPLAGWRALLSLLRPGGFMKLGFYSEVGRRNIVKAREFIAERGYGVTADEIRRCRQNLLDLDKSKNFGTDFFSISTCRDLLFHSQEHQMTLTSIDAFLQDNNLTFLGFDIDGDVLHAYKQRFPDDRPATNLGQWQTFENENPDTFRGMYQFWIQKAG